MVVGCGITPSRLPAGHILTCIENGRLCAVQSTEPGTLSTSCCKRLTISGHAGLLCQSQFRPHGLQKIQTDETGRLGNLDNRFNRDRAKYIRYRMFKAFVHRHGKEPSFVPCTLQIIPRACFDRPWSIQHIQTQKQSRCCPSLAGVCDWLATCLLLTQKRQALTGDIRHKYCR